MLRICVVVGVLAGCPSPPAIHEVRRTAAIPRAFPDAWAALADLITDRGWAIQTIDRSSGIVATDWMNSRDRYVDCGGVASLVTIRFTRVRINIRLRERGDSTEAVVNTWFEQMRAFGDQSRLIACNSTGVLESEIQARIAGH